MISGPYTGNTDVNGHGEIAAPDETRHARFLLPVPSPQSSPASGRGGEREKLLLIPEGEGANKSLRELHDNNLFLLAINLTNRCNLACAHCYMDAKTLKYGDENELTTDEVRGLLDDIAGRSTETMIVLTAGEPLMLR